MRRIFVAGMALGFALGPFIARATAGSPPPTLAHRRPVMVAGDPMGSPPDSPQLRVDPNTAASPYGGVGSLFVDAYGGSGYLASGTLVDPYHVITAGHAVDIDGDGSSDVSPSQVTFFLNYGANYSHAVPAAAIHVHPDYTGFNNPSVNDDIVVLRLSSPIFAVPYYPLHREPLAAGATIAAVGYGRSGDGVEGFTTGASFIEKRWGLNQVDLLEPDDEGGPDSEVFVFDFDDPAGGNGYTGGPSLGNGIETTLGPGDSGGPSFVVSDGRLELAGVNTFIGDFEGGPEPPYFNSAGGGILIAGVLDWLDTIVPIPGDANGDRRVDGADFTVWSDHFGASGASLSEGDFNYDRRVDGGDFTIWNDAFGQGAGVAATIPEPSSARGALLALAVGALAFRRLRPARCESASTAHWGRRAS